MEKQKKSCALMTEHFQKSVLFTAGQAQFSTTNKRLKSLLPPSTCCKLAASTGVDINRKYEQIINTVITRTIGQNDFIFTTGQASIEWHKAITPPSSGMKIFAVLSFEGFRKTDSLAVF